MMALPVMKHVHMYYNYISSIYIYTHTIDGKKTLAVIGPSEESNRISNGYFLCLVLNVSSKPEVL